MNAYRLISLGLCAAGLLLFPWYALQDSFFAFKWIKSFSGKEFAPALLQVSQFGRGWLAPLFVLAVAAAFLLAKPWQNIKLWAQTLAIIGIAGVGYLLAQGFAISAQGYAFEGLKAFLPNIGGGQFGMGAGALLVAFGFVLIAADGIASMGYFRGDRFVASSLIIVMAAVVLFVFFPDSFRSSGLRYKFKEPLPVKVEKTEDEDQ